MGLGPLFVFISHRHTEKVLVGDLKNRLETYGFNCFVAHDDIRPSAQFEREIADALSRCQCLVAVISDDFHQGGWCDQEVGWALGRNIPVIPILLTEKVVAKGLLRAVQQIRVNANPEEAIGRESITGKVVDALLAEPRTCSLAQESLVYCLRNSRAYSTSRDIMDRLDRSPTLEPHLVDVIQDAYNSNDQVSGWGGSWRVLDLINQHRPTS